MWKNYGFFRALSCFSTIFRTDQARNSAIFALFRVRPFIRFFDLRFAIFDWGNEGKPKETNCVNEHEFMREYKWTCMSNPSGMNATLPGRVPGGGHF
jgi:hypothetical protein